MCPPPPPQSVIASYGPVCVSNICTKENKILGFPRRNLYSCPKDVKETAFKGLIRPVLEHCSSVWEQQGTIYLEELESVQKRDYNYVTGSMSGKM